MVMSWQIGCDLRILWVSFTNAIVPLPLLFCITTEWLALLICSIETCWASIDIFLLQQLLKAPLLV